MKKIFRIPAVSAYWLLSLVLCFSFIATSSFTLEAGEIPLPQGLFSKAEVMKSERDGMWEKSLVVHFPEKRRVLSTTDGWVDALAVVNHAAQPQLWFSMCQVLKTEHEVGGKVYLRNIRERIARQLGISPDAIAQTGTAADMDNLAVVTKVFKPFTVTVLVTAGAETNALRTGVDEGAYVEGGEDPKGTVNILVLTDARLTDGAMARAIITATEAKTAAFQDLRVPSSYTKGVQATGTGTDSIIVVSGKTGPVVTQTGGHSKIGELIGKAVYEAVLVALEKQNGFTLPAKGADSRQACKQAKAGK
ncbi:MAG: adenosylcobinamide amidohydrolase [Thermodesulfovibrionales bacterium]